MKLFQLKRETDISGVSGTGVVAEGCMFASGKIAISFFPVKPTYTASVTVYNSMDEVEKIHGHDGATSIVWLSGKEKYDAFAKQWREAVESNYKSYDDVRMRGGNPSDYGSKTDEEIIVMLLKKKNAQIY